MAYSNSTKASLVDFTTFNPKTWGFQYSCYGVMWRSREGRDERRTGSWFQRTRPLAPHSTSLIHTGGGRHRNRRCQSESNGKMLALRFPTAKPPIYLTNSYASCALSLACWSSVSQKKKKEKTKNKKKEHVLMGGT